MSSCGTTNVKFQLRRDTSVNWNGKVLKDGEPGFATDTNILKIGLNGIPWQSLSPVGPVIAPTLILDGGSASNPVSVPGPTFDCGASS
jgi:hypothetical protein